MLIYLARFDIGKHCLIACHVLDEIYIWHLNISLALARNNYLYYLYYRVWTSGHCCLVPRSAHIYEKFLVDAFVRAEGTSQARCMPNSLERGLKSVRLVFWCKVKPPLVVSVLRSLNIITLSFIVFCRSIMRLQRGVSNIFDSAMACVLL